MTKSTTNKHKYFNGTKKEKHRITATTTDLGNWLNRKMVLYLDDLANPKNGLNLVPNPL